MSHDTTRNDTSDKLRAKSYTRAQSAVVHEVHERGAERARGREEREAEALAGAFGTFLFALDARRLVVDHLEPARDAMRCDTARTLQWFSSRGSSSGGAVRGKARAHFW